MRKTGGGLKKSGWHVQNGYRLAGKMHEDWTPSAWEKLLRELGISEAMAINVALESSERGMMLRSFAKRECGRKYVPEDVLDVLGIRSDVETFAGFLDKGHLAVFRRHIGGHMPAEARQG